MQSKVLTLLTALFVTLLVISNIIASKVGSFFGLYLSVAVIAFPCTYIISDVVTEVYGFVAMRRVIWTGFLCNLLAVALMVVASAIPSAPFYGNQDAFATILGVTPRILFASFVGYLIGSFANSVVMSKMKVWQQGKMLPVRAIASTIVGQGLDSLFFISLAFWGIFEGGQIVNLIVMQWLGKTLLETIVSPFTAWFAGFLKRCEQTDVYDRQVSFNPFSF